MGHSRALTLLCVRSFAPPGELREQETRPQVVINEYVDVARAFFEGGRRAKVRDAVLDHMALRGTPRSNSDLVAPLTGANRQPANV